MDQDHAVDVKVVTDDSKAEGSNVPHAKVLIALADAVVQRNEPLLPGARQNAIDALGVDGFADAAAVIGNFERMNRIADAAGLELDTPVRVLSSDIRDQIGINSFATAAHTKPTGRFTKLLARAGLPIAARLLPKRRE